MDFIRRLIIPILERLGFRVMIYHGTREFGRDLVFGATDRFGEYVFHGLQAKYVESISQRDSHDLVRDAVEAFTVPFDHPIKGTKEYISTFYAVNGGSIADNGRTFFYSSLLPRYGANVRMLDGNEVIRLERRSYVDVEVWVGKLSSLLNELSQNRAALISVSEAARTGTALPNRRLRDDCASDYLKNPEFGNLDLQELGEYLEATRIANEIIHCCAYVDANLSHVQTARSELVRVSSSSLDLCERILSSVRGSRLAWRFCSAIKPESSPKLWSKAEFGPGLRVVRTFQLDNELVFLDVRCRNGTTRFAKAVCATQGHARRRRAMCCLGDVPRRDRPHRDQLEYSLQCRLLSVRRLHFRELKRDAGTDREPDVERIVHR